MHMIRTQIYLLAVIISLFALAPFARADALTDGIQTRYRTAKSMQATFTQVLRHKESGGEEHRSGNMFFKAPDRIRWVTQKPSPELLVVNPEVVWNYFEDEEVAYKYPASLVHETKTALRFITGQTNLEDDFYVEKGEAVDGLTQLHLFAKQPTTDMTEATLWVGADHAVRRVLTVDFYGNENEIAFSDIQFDTPMKDELFFFTPPKGVDVEDRTKSVQEGKVGE